LPRTGLRRRVGRWVRPVPILRALLAALSVVSHAASASCAELAFRRPRRSRPSRGEQRRLNGGRLSWLRGPGGDLAVWHWGSGPRVLLVHGWGGHAGRLTAFVQPLLEAGFGVVAFDAPAHGISGGRLATLPDFTRSVELVAGVVAPVALVGHSMGAAACALAVRGGLSVRAVVLLAPPADPEVYTSRFARYLRLSACAADSMKERLERRYGVKFPSLRLPAGPPGVPALVVHDRRDKRVPVRDGIAICRSWPKARLLLTSGLGHHRILRSPEVVRRSVRYLFRHAEGSDNSRNPRRLAGSPAPAQSTARFLKQGGRSNSGPKWEDKTMKRIAGAAIAIGFLIGGTAGAQSTQPQEKQHTETVTKHTGPGPDAKMKTETVVGTVKEYEAGKKIKISGPGDKSYSFDLDKKDQAARVDGSIAVGQMAKVEYQKADDGSEVVNVISEAPAGTKASASAAAPRIHSESTTKHTGPGPDSKVKTETVVGTVKTYEPGKKLTVTGPKDKDYSFDLDENVAFKGDVAVGQRVKVMYTKTNGGEKITSVMPYKHGA
jgi:pimeloyl-ACP methyl ester carboxylesterase